MALPSPSSAGGHGRALGHRPFGGIHEQPFALLVFQPCYGSLLFSSAIDTFLLLPFFGDTLPHYGGQFHPRLASSAILVKEPSLDGGVGEPIGCHLLV